MAKMARYCKAYSVADLKRYPGWNVGEVDASILVGGEEDESSGHRALRDDDYLFVQENLVVTAGIFLDENVLFQESADAWRRFCESELRFAIPEEVLKIEESEAPAVKERAGTAA